MAYFAIRDPFSFSLFSLAVYEEIMRVCSGADAGGLLEAANTLNLRRFVPFQLRTLVDGGSQ